ncbi:Uncharacterised protein [Mycobacteroides abscessus subsp. abscessus]|nr:Uncharacterised protein [Mycobacteroides abscessus subsp. abscessus]
MTAWASSARSSSPSPSAPRRAVRRVRLWERACTNPARCAASCTLSVNINAFFSAASRFSSPNRFDRVTDSWVATALPRNRMPSAAPQAGHTSFLDCSSASGPSRVSTGSTFPSTASGLSGSGAVDWSSRWLRLNHRRFSTLAATCASAGAVMSERKRGAPAAWSARMASSVTSSALPVGASRAPQPERPQCRQYTAGRWSSVSSATAPSSDQR